jgi:branched-chain amino acid transport system ATP-binding protein
MVALGRALMAAPEILLVDEPSVGLAPTLVRKTIEVVADLKRRLGLTVLIAEQNLMQAIRIVDRGYVLVHGRVAFEGRSAAELSESPLVRDIYLGR